MAEPRKNGGKTESGRFTSGNPGRPKGARNKTTIAVELLLQGEAEAIGRKCAEMAAAGDATAMRLAMERLSPVRRDRPVQFELPVLDSAADLPRALAAVLTAVAQGTVTPNEAVAIAQVIETRRRAIELMELEQRVAALERTGS